MAFHRSYVLSFVAILIVATLIGCNKEQGNGAQGGGNKGGGGVGTYEWTAGICNLPSNGNCTSANTCQSGGSCSVGLAVDSGTGGVDLTLNGQALSGTQQIVCTAQGAAVTFSVGAQPGGGHNSFLLDFGNSAPFTNNSNLSYATGSDTASTTLNAPNTDGCFKYNVKVCPIPATAGGSISCGQSDPKVIVGSGGTMVKRPN